VHRLGQLFVVLAGQTRTDDANRVTSQAFGINFASDNVNVPQPDIDLWVDDVIVHSSPVTCAD
jgi:hypothetical protein